MQNSLRLGKTIILVTISKRPSPGLFYCLCLMFAVSVIALAFWAVQPVRSF